MHHVQLDQVRNLICSVFAEYSVDTSEVLREGILIRDGFYCGRRFEADGMQAIWFVEENQVKIFDREGGVVQVCDLTPIAENQVA